MYQLVFKGQCAPGVEVGVARANVARVFKASDAQLDRMFSGERVVIRNKLDAEAAGKYQSALAKQGIVVHIEAMAPPAGEPPPTLKPDSGPTEPASAPSRPEPGTPVDSRLGSGPPVEPGDRLPVAGERVDQLLATSSLSLGPAGATLGPAQAVAQPTFEHMDSWSVAPAGERLVEAAAQPEPALPDLSHLAVLPPGQR